MAIKTANTAVVAIKNVLLVDVLFSGEKDASDTIKTGSGGFGGIIITTDGTNDAVVSVYDNTAASGTKVVPQITVKGSEHYGGPIFLPVLLPVTNGIYVSVSGTGAKYEVYYTE